MGTSKPAEPAKLFVAIMFERNISIEEVLARLEKKFGPRECSVGPLPFSWTDYYEKEMGKDLLKIFCCYKKLIERDALPSIKLWTNDVERDYPGSGGRRVNIDPGYLSRDKLVLASTKDFFHRLYLADGIYGEVTLHCRRDVFRYFSWTYPDYKEAVVHEMLIKARISLVEEPRNKKIKCEE
jgi:hypothetical protein